MKTKKLAVEPIHPAAAAALVSAPVIPINWRSAFAMLARQVTAFAEHQAGQIRTLTDELADACGCIAAGDRTRADQAEQIRALTADLAAAKEQSTAATESAVAAAIEKLTAAGDTLEQALTKRLDEQAEQIGTTDKTVAEALTRADELARTLGAVEQQAAGTAATVDVQAGAVRAQGEKLAKLAGTAAETEQGLTDLRNGVEAAGKVVAGIQLHFDELFSDLDGKVNAIVKGQDGFRETVAGVQKYAGDCFNIAMEAITGEAESQAKAVAEVVAAVERLDQGTQKALAVTSDALAEITATVEKVATDGAKNADAYDKLNVRTHAIAEGVKDLGGTVAAATRARVDDRSTLDELVKTVADAGEVVGVLDDKLTETVKAQGEQALRLSSVEEVAAGAGAASAIATGEVSKLHQAVAGQVDTIRAIGEQATDALRRVTLAIDQIPAAMMIDRAGHLHRVNRAGETVDLGKVVDQGKDGKDAPQLVAARVEGDRLIMTLTDRTEISCSIAGLKVADPAPAVPEIDPTTIGHLSKDAKMRAVQIEDMTNLRGSGWTFAKIGKKYDCSARTVARLIRGLEDDEAPNA